MRVLVVADGRSPITRRWIQTVRALGHEVVLISTFPSAPVEGVEAEVCLPVAFAGLAGSGAGAGNAPGAGASRAKKVVAAFRPLFMAGRYRLGPLSLRYYGPRLRWLVERLEPDLIHALRIPYEGMLASWAPPGVPLAISIWGNDLTLHAGGSAAMAKLTRRALARADALVVDAQRDVRLAREWGLKPGAPALVVPGSGGLDLEEIAAVRAKVTRFGSSFDGPLELGSPGEGAPLVLNPRGFRTGSVRQDTFFEALPLVLERNPNVRFACAAMAGQREALDWFERIGRPPQLTLLPHLPQEDLWELFARAAVSVSVSQHDGTPNSLLEAMALGATPVAGDIESIREWITPGVNGLLVEPGKPQALAEAILLAVENASFRRRAAQANAQVIAERAGAQVVREQIGLFYTMLGGMKEIEG